jgi:hypothetical protein
VGRFAIVTTCVAVCALALAPAPAVVAQTADFGRQLVPAGSWLGGHGVTVYSNGSSRLHCGAASGSCESWIGPHSDIDAGAKWQCVELAQRLYIIRGWYPRKFGVPYAYLIWAAAPRLGMTRTPNGTLWAGALHPGDMIVWKPSVDVGSAGHVAIVDTVVGTQVAVEEQNWGQATTSWDRQRGRSVYAVARGRLNGHGLPPSDIYGVVHSPRDHLTNEGVAASATIRGAGDGGGRDDLASVPGSIGMHRM